MLTGASKVTLNIPRDRSGTFDPKLIAKYQRRFPDFDTKIISMYARGMTPRAPRGALRDRRVAGHDLDGDGRRASRHAGGMGRSAALATVTEWPGRPLAACHPLRSAARRVGKEGVRACRSRGWQ